MARELTKIHEQYRRGTLDELAAEAERDPPRGEVTIVVEGASEAERAGAGEAIDLEAEVDARIAAGEIAKEIAAALAITTGKPRRMIYQLVVARSGKGKGE